MTTEELDKLIEARRFIADAEYGPCRIEDYRDILKRLRDHKRDGMPQISCTIDFLHIHAMIDADVLIKVYEDEINGLEEHLKECKELIEKARL